jgi:hypothetical protein
MVQTPNVDVTTDPQSVHGPVLFADSRLRRGLETSAVSDRASAASWANSFATAAAPWVSSALSVICREYSRASISDPVAAARSSTRLPSLPPSSRAVSEYVRGAANNASRRTSSFNGDDVRELSGGSDMFTHSRRLTESLSKTLSRIASHSHGRPLICRRSSGWRHASVVQHVERTVLHRSITAESRSGGVVLTRRRGQVSVGMSARARGLAREGGTPRCICIAAGP